MEGSTNDGLSDVQELTVPDIKDLIESTPDGNARDALKAEIRTAELANDNPRQGVLELTEPPAPPAPPATSPVEEEPPAEDTSGRPPLAHVAQQRADTVIERVIPAQEEN